MHGMHRMISDILDSTQVEKINKVTPIVRHKEVLKLIPKYSL